VDVLPRVATIDWHSQFYQHADVLLHGVCPIYTTVLNSGCSRLDKSQRQRSPGVPEVWALAIERSVHDLALETDMIYTGKSGRVVRDANAPPAEAPKS
jgi:hypothetical protein